MPQVDIRAIKEMHGVAVENFTITVDDRFAPAHPARSRRCEVCAYFNRAGQMSLLNYLGPKIQDDEPQWTVWRCWCGFVYSGPWSEDGPLKRLFHAARIEYEEGQAASSRAAYTQSMTARVEVGWY